MVIVKSGVVICVGRMLWNERYLGAQKRQMGG